MKINVGTTDRIIRGVIGIAIVATGVYYQSWWGLIGAVLIGTALIRFCPLYLPFGLSSHKKK